jgi:hypothetical protein
VEEALMVMRVRPDALPVDVDRERRERGIGLKRWLEAPAPPTKRAECENGPRPCPHLRCCYHIGERGDGSFTCELDFAELPAEERTLERVASVLGTSFQRVHTAQRTALDKARSRAPHDVLIALGIRRRPTGQR